jgi:FkbM family methyltransferase
MKNAKAAVRWPLSALLETPALSRRLAFGIKYEHFADLDLRIPLSHGFCCPIFRLDALMSFSEIFVQGEYSQLWEHMELPKRWVDLGCHTGYFTLYVAWQRARYGLSPDWSAILIDGDPRAVEAAGHTLRVNNMESKCLLKNALIGTGHGHRSFALRQGMVSSADLTEEGTEALTEVPIIEQNELLDISAGPFDLVKLDIEGAEWEFLQSYGDVVTAAKHLVIEWHSRNKDEDIDAKLATGLLGRGFCHVVRLNYDEAVDANGRFYRTGVELYRRA